MKRRIILLVLGPLLILTMGIADCDEDTVGENVPVSIETEVCGGGEDFTPEEAPPTLEPC